MSFTELQNKIVTLRKPRKCIGCLEQFSKGDKLRYRSYIFEGLQSDHICEPCYDYMMALPYDELEDGFGPGDIGNWRNNS